MSYISLNLPNYYDIDHTVMLPNAYNLAYL
jgi:hypothetical protein